MQGWGGRGGLRGLLRCNSISNLWYDRRGLSEADGEPRLRLQDQHGADEAGLHTAGPVQADRTGISNTGPVGLPLGFFLPPGGLFLETRSVELRKGMRKKFYILPGRYQGYLRGLILNLVNLSAVQCCGSMNFWYGSGYRSWSCYARHWLSRRQQKTNLKKVFLLITFWRYIYIIFQKKLQNSRNQGFSYYFCLMMEGSGAGSGSIHLTKESGSGRPKNMWIRWIRIRDTACRSSLGFLPLSWGFLSRWVELRKRMLETKKMPNKNLISSPSRLSFNCNLRELKW